MTRRLLMLLLPLLLMFLSCGPPAVAMQSLPELRIRLDPAEHRLSGELHIQFAPPLRRDWRLRLSPRAEILQVSLAGKPAGYRFQDGWLQLELPPSSVPVALQVRYRLEFPDRPPANPVHSEDPSYGVSASIQPEGTYLGTGTGWLPITDRAQPQLLEVVAPEGYRAVTSGRFIESLDQGGQTVTRWQLAGKDDGLALAAGPYQIHRSNDGVPVYAFFSADTQELAASYLETAREYLKLYQKLFGPYPFPQFVIAENFFPTGYGFPGWTLLGSSVIRLPFIVHTSLVHELAHCWWGNGVRPDRSQGNWSEGLATYVADALVKERSSPAEAREYRLKILRDYATLADGGGALRDFQARFDRRSQVIGYGKGAMVFHMIRRQIGDQAFWAGLREAARRYMFATASWEDLLQCFADQGDPELPGQFRPWLTRSDIPELAFGQVEVNASNAGWTVSGVVEQRGKPWALQLEVRLQGDGEEQVLRLRLEGVRTPFKFTTGWRPVILQGDPQVDLMRRLDPVEIPATVNHLRAADPLTVYSCTADPSLDQRPLQTLLAALRQTRTKVARVARLPQPLPDGSLLVYGRGCEGSLAVEPNAQATELLAGRQLPATDQSVLAVRKRADRPGSVVGLFFPAAGADALVVARKIPHYGNYSYLAFTGSRNVSKITWQADASPLLIRLPNPGDE